MNTATTYSHGKSIVTMGRAFVVALALLLNVNAAMADKGNGADFFGPDPGNVGYDETSVFVNVQRIGGTELPAAIKGKTVYLPVSNLFDFIKIKNTINQNLDSVTGFFIQPDARFCVDFYHYQIIFKDKIFQLKPDDIIRSESNLYIKQDYFNIVFGLNCVFDFSNLLVKVSTAIELPAMREIQLQQMHQNVSKLKGEIKADTTYSTSYPLFRMGIADWALSTSQQTNGSHDYKVGLAIGSVIAGGEANIYLNFNSAEAFNERQQFYQWRLVNNDRKVARQLTLGRIITHATASVYNPVIGAMVTNAPSTYRRSFGTYRLMRTTQPGWTVELYINNILVDYTKADAAGLFSFDVPLVYGSSVIKLRYYGLYGEERTSEENISIPFNFLPKHELEYTVTAGVVKDGENSKYAKAIVNYGLGTKMTVGVGTEYLSSVTSGKHMPFAVASLRMSSNLMLSGEYTYGVRGRAMLSYRMPINAQLELNYTHYTRGQKAIIYNYINESKLLLSVPFHAKHLSGVTRLMYNRIKITENSSYSTAEWLLSTSFNRVSANLNTYMVAAGQQDPPVFEPYIYSNASIAFRFNKGFIFTPQAQYSYKEKEIFSLKCELEKYIFSRGFLNISYEKNLKSNLESIGLGLRFDLSYARIGFAARNYNDNFAVTESASGSIAFDSKTGYSRIGNRASVGRGGIAILAYLDLNANGHRDADEPKVGGIKVRINSGRVDYSNRDTIVRLYDLEPYTNYLVDISQNSFENIGWQIRMKALNVAADPNQFKLIEVPVLVMGEAAGTVYYKGTQGTKGQGRITIVFCRPDGSIVGSTVTDPDGYFSYMGLPPGEYIVAPDKAQMKNLKMNACTPKNITIQPSRDGVLIDGLDFTLQPVSAEGGSSK